MIASLSASSHADLSLLNTMALASCADVLCPLTAESQIEPLFDSIVHDHAPFMILSGGSNVLLPPQLNAHVIQPLFKGIDILSENDSEVSIEVMAGESWHDLVTTSVSQGWFGLENLALIPGLTGAAPVQNIGAYGVQLEDCLTHVRAYHIPSQTWHDMDRQSCGFAYRDSCFKQQSGQWLISRVGFKLHKDAQRINVKYGDVQQVAQTFADGDQRSHLSPIDVMKAIINIRQSKLPDPAILPNCGSFFKNPIIPTEQFELLKRQFPDIVGYRIDEATTKVAAGWLIDHAGLKGAGIAPILVHDHQALVLTNHSKLLDLSPAQQTDVAATQSYIQKQIWDRYGVSLEREPVWINADGSINLTNAGYTP